MKVIRIFSFLGFSSIIKHWYTSLFSIVRDKNQLTNDHLLVNFAAK